MKNGELFSNTAFQQLFNRNGYIVTDTLLSASQVGTLLQELKPYSGKPQSDLFFSLMGNSYDDNLKVAAIIEPVIQQIVAAYFNATRINTPAFLVKPAHTTQELYLHQDWNYTDEATFQSATVWLPLTDTNPQNGGLFVLPGSHNWVKNYRSASLETARIPLSPRLQPYIESLNIKAGQAVIFHPALFHGSYPNASPNNRTVVNAILLPAQAPFVHYTQNIHQPGTVNCYPLPEDALFKWLTPLANNNMAVAGNPISEASWHYTRPTEDDILQFIAKQADGGNI